MEEWEILKGYYDSIWNMSLEQFHSIPLGGGTIPVLLQMITC